MIRSTPLVSPSRLHPRIHSHRLLLGVQTSQFFILPKIFCHQTCLLHLLINLCYLKRLSLVVELASFLWHLFFLDPFQRIQAVSRSVVYVDKASHSPSPHRRNGYIIIVSAYVWRWRTDEWAFENSFPKRTRSSISACYSLLLYVLGMKAL